ncbi:MAG: glutamate-ammonia-ligase adenylyltransferase [Gammaproteobacteria bacterium]|nr:glutamate-ammonia-ligase adenylyltransferase [Gammaproteobacteria bacterium]
MDRGTKIYAIVLGIISITLLVIFLYESPKVRELNNRLESINEIKDFPYYFKVLRINNGIATMNSPISTELPCGKIIGILFPAVEGKSLLSPDYQKAQKLLAKIQMLASTTVKSDPAVSRIVWELDRSWLIQNGVSLNNF